MIDNRVVRHSTDLLGVDFNIFMNEAPVEYLKENYIHLLINRDTDSVLIHITLDKNLNLIEYKKEIGD